MSRRVVVLILWTIGVLCGSQLVLSFFCGLLYGNLFLALGNIPLVGLAMQVIASLGLIGSVGLTAYTAYLGVKTRLPYQVVRHLSSAV